MAKEAIGVDKLAEWVLPADISWLTNSKKALELISDLRWADGAKCCPRCNSRSIVTVNTEDRRELFRCRNCTYLFNKFAGTFFQSAHLPLNKVLQFLVVLNAYGDDLSMKDLCFIMGCTYKTAKLWRARGDEVRTSETFARIDRKLASALASIGGAIQVLTDDFLQFCAIRGIVVNEYVMRDYIEQICKINMSTAQKDPGDASV